MDIKSDCKHCHFLSCDLFNSKPGCQIPGGKILHKTPEFHAK